MKRQLDRGNPWGLTVREVAVMRNYIELGDCAAVHAATGMPLRGIEDALQRVRRKMGVANIAQQIAKWVEWNVKAKDAGPRTAWVCLACRGLGFVTTRSPA